MRYSAAVILVILLNNLVVNGQNEYFATDSLTAIGVKLNDGGDLINSQFCQVKKGNKIIRYTPYEVKEFGFKGGKIYVSKQIQTEDSTKRVFLEQLHKGKTTLYYYRGKGVKTFFIERDSTLFVEIPREDKTQQHYSELLLNYTGDCPNVSNATKLVSYNKSSFTKLISQYDACELKPFPFLKYGLFFGMIQSKLIINADVVDAVLSKTTFEYNKNLYYGLFVDMPINASEFSVFASLGFYRSSFSYYARLDLYDVGTFYDVDLLVKQTTIKMPLMIRYTLPSLNFRPYVNMGFSTLYNLKNKAIVNKAEINGDNIQYESPNENDLVADFQLGYACGLGVQYNINFKSVLFVEIRFNKEYSLNTKDLFNKNSIELISGINF